MHHNYVRLCGVAALLRTTPALRVAGKPATAGTPNIATRRAARNTHSAGSTRWDGRSQGKTVDLTFMTNPIKYATLAMCLLFVAFPCTAADFFLKNGDKVVMMGDSITEQHLYSSYVKLGPHPVPFLGSEVLQCGDWRRQCDWRCRTLQS